LKPILAKAGKEVNVIRWTDEGYEGYGQSLTASRKFMTERPDVLRRFLKVMKESVVLAYKDTDQAAKYVHEWVPQIDIETVKGQIDAGKQFIFNPVTERDGLGMYAPARVKTSWEWVAKANNYPLDKLDPMKLVDTSFVTR
jgi:NitT/TauT family transport system substrate-binding protein